MTPAVARAILALAAAVGGGSPHESPLVLRPRREARSYGSSRESALATLSPADAERVRLAAEMRARRAAKLDALVAKGAIRRAEDSDSGRHGAQGDPATLGRMRHETPAGDRT